MAITATIVRPAKVISELASGLKEIPEAVKAYYTFDGVLFSTWILVDLYELPVLRTVFDLQQDIMRRNQELEFDFYVVAPSKTEDADPLFTDAEIAYFRAA